MHLCGAFVSFHKSTMSWQVLNRDFRSIMGGMCCCIFRIALPGVGIGEGINGCVHRVSGCSLVCTLKF